MKKTRHRVPARNGFAEEQWAHPDFNAGLRGRAEPVPVRAENQRVDDVVRLKLVQVLPLVQVPQHRGSVFATTGAQGA